MLEDKMDIAQRVVYLTRSIRAKSNLKVRQPLNKIMVAVDKSKREAVNYMKDVILEEVNIKQLEVLEDDSSIVNKSAKANFKTLGPKYGKLVKKLASRITGFTKEEISALEKDGSYEVFIDDEPVVLTGEDVEIISTEIEGWVVESEEGITVAIDSELTEELLAEGYSRELVNRIQNLRKESGFEVMDRIIIGVQTDGKFINYINQFTEYITTETLADKINTEFVDNGISQKLEIGEFQGTLSVSKS
jgi:isoleucyl-tRNA synthetase